MSSIEQILEAGIVGCGGAGFPTHIKYKGSIEQLIVNGAECEPLLHTDRYIMRTFASRLITTVAVLKKEFDIPKCVIALKGGYTAEVAALQSAIRAQNAPVELYLLDSFYPAGDEQILVYEVTRKVVPPAGIPIDVGCVVSNVATILAIGDAMDGKPFTHKYLTVSGEVETPMILHVPLGTPLTACIEQAGGAVLTDYCVLLGGPMMGKVITGEKAEAAVVTKTISGIILLPADHIIVQRQQIDISRMVSRARAACIRCSQCTELCPRHLLGHPIEPHKLMRRIALEGKIENIPPGDTVMKSALLCSECGVCEAVACPMGLQPRRINAAVKQLLGKQGVRYPKGEMQEKVNPMREARRPATSRVAARAGVWKYQNYRIEQFSELSVAMVRLPLSQHIGAKCEPIVKTGERVEVGQMIARSPEGKLGTTLHASISGTVSCSEDTIIISADRRGDKS